MIRKLFTTSMLLLAVVASTSAAEKIDKSEYTAKEKTEMRQHRRDSIRANKKVWTSVLGGPSYTPEASLGVAGAVLLSFKTNKADTVSQRSYLPAGVNISINGTLVVAGVGSFFFNENKFRIYSRYGYRNEPSNFYGVGFNEIDGVERGDETTAFHKQNIYFDNRFVWEVKPNFFIGPVMDINYSNSSDINAYMAENSYVNKYSTKYTNIGLGGVVQLDSRDDVATPHTGMLLSALSKTYSRAFGGSYNYQFLDLEYRQFQPLFKRAVLAWSARTQMTFGDVPFTELPMFGSPFDLRGFYWGQYRDKTMAYGITEFRHMFGTEEQYKAGRPISKFGYVVWAGTGTLGTTPKDWDQWKVNYGFGLRAQIQPGKNFRVDIGKGVGEKGFLFYMNMTEAF